MDFLAFSGHRNKTVTEADLDTIAERFPKTVWVHGGAGGFDSQVARYAAAHRIRTVVIRPTYMGGQDKFAPNVRNYVIVNSAPALVACYDGRESGGTFHAVRYARSLDKEVVVLQGATQEAEVTP